MKKELKFRAENFSSKWKFDSQMYQPLVHTVKTVTDDKLALNPFKSRKRRSDLFDKLWVADMISNLCGYLDVDLLS